MCELTLLVTSIAVVIFYLGWRNPEWTKCSVHFVICIYIRSKLGSYRHYFGMRQFPEQMFVWLIGFQIYMCPGFLLLKCMINYHSSVEFVVNESQHHLIIHFQHQIPITIRLVVFLRIRILVKQSQVCSIFIIIIMWLECQWQFR